MANKNLNYEDYPAIGDALVASVTRDLGDFAEHYTKMDTAFIAGFKNAIDAVRSAASVLAQTEQRKGVTKQLYDLADEANKKLFFLIDYLEDADLETQALSAIRNKFTNRNLEGGVRDLREILPYLQSQKTVLEAGEMPKGFLDYFAAIIPQMESLNVEQISILSTRKTIVEANLALFETAYDFISKVSNRGKKVFKKSVKKDDYTLSKLLTRVRAEAKTVSDANSGKTTP